MAEDKKALNLNSQPNLNESRLNLKTGTQIPKAWYKDPGMYEALNQIAQGTHTDSNFPPIFGKLLLAFPEKFTRTVTNPSSPTRTKSLNVNTGKRSYTNMKKGGKVKAKKPRDGRIKKAKGRDGIAQRGKTRGRMR